MSRHISNVFQLAYDAEVKRAYGNKRSLAGTTREKSVEDAKSVYFRKKGKGMATLHQPGADVRAMNVEYNQVLCNLQDWEAKELAEVASDALGLRMDQIVIDALAAGYDSSNMKVGATQTALTINTLLAAKTLLNK